MIKEMCRVGMVVSFGRATGAKTIGKVVKINDKKAKVQTLEGRGQHPAGQVWAVPYSLLTPAEAPAAQPYPNGLTITGVRYLTGREMESEGWDAGDAGVALTLSDGSVIFASQDYEGNGAGALFGRMCTGEHFILSPAQKESEHASVGCV